jgi:hypothetical protein
MPLQAGNEAPEDWIADAMVVVLQAVEALQEPEIHIAAPIDIVRAVESLQQGHLLIDIWAVGAVQSPLNRRAPRWDYEVHMGLRCKVATVDRSTVSMLSWYRSQAQAAFAPKAKLLLPDGSTAHCLESEPFAPYSRDSLRERGLYVAPVRFKWARSAKGG